MTVSKDAGGEAMLSTPHRIDSKSTAVAVSLTGPPVVEEPEYALTPNADGSFKLGAADATLDGRAVQVEGEGDKSNIGYWSRARDTVAWTLVVPENHAGRFTISMEYSCDPGTGGSTFELQVDGKPSGVTGTVEKTASWADYRTVNLDGTLTLPAGKHVVKVVPKTKPGDDVMNLRGFMLVPVAR